MESPPAETLFSTFADFLEQSDLPMAAHWGEKLLQLGFSSETFRADADINAVVEVLVSQGVPRILAMDFCRSATRFFHRQHKLASLPLAVFWDAENVRIPAAMAPHTVHSRMRTTLAPFGLLSDLFLYQDPNSGVTLRTRAAMQACGWQMIDTPHVSPQGSHGGNTKEVADKMIIVDALLYCMKHQASGATVCFITADSDFAYLLAKLRSFPAIRTISVIPNMASSSLLGAAANHVLSWNDILGRSLSPASPAKHSDDESSGGSSSNAGSRRPSLDTVSVVKQAVSRRGQAMQIWEDAGVDDSSECDMSSSDDSDSLVLLGVITHCEPEPGAPVLRSLIGTGLKIANPVRFGKGKTRKIFRYAAAAGLVILGGSKDEAWCKRTICKSE